MSGLNDIAHVLLKAAERAKQHAGCTFVVKLGGSAMEEPAATRGTLESLVALQQFGIRIILVHGGGKPIDRAMAAAGLEPKKVAGRRYTDAATLEIVVKVLRELSGDIVSQIQKLGGKAYGFLSSGLIEEYPLRAVPLKLNAADGSEIDLGMVGKVTEVRALELESVDFRGEIPVLASVASDAYGSDSDPLNINADTAASAIAGTMHAEAAIFLTDTPGVLANRNDPSSLYARLTVADCQRLIHEGVIAGGMIPKVEACLEALEAGAKRAVILDGRNPYALLGEFLTDVPAGTAIVS